MPKPNVYADVPKFDQATQAVFQLPPEEREDCIYYGVQVVDLPPSEEHKEGEPPV